MTNEMLFESGDITVDAEFIRFTSGVIRVAEIRRLSRDQYRTDGCTAPIAWVFTSLIFIVWIAAPNDNAPIIPVLIGFAAFALYRQFNPKPTRHTIWINTGGSLNSRLCDTEDEEFVSQLYTAIETAISASKPQMD